MSGFIDTIKAILTRLFFCFHGITAIYKVVDQKHDPVYWCLASTLLVLVFEGILTLKCDLNWKRYDNLSDNSWGLEFFEASIIPSWPNVSF